MPTRFDRIKETEEYQMFRRFEKARLRESEARRKARERQTDELRLKRRMWAAEVRDGSNRWRIERARREYEKAALLYGWAVSRHWYGSLSEASDRMAAEIEQ